MTEDLLSNQISVRPYVCNTVRAVGTIKPQFDAGQKGFLPPQLRILGTGFWLQHTEAFVTCAHVVGQLVQGPVEISGMLVVGGNGAPYLKASVTFIDYMHDLAVLHVEGDGNFLQQQSANGLDFIDRQIQVGERVAYAGFPFGNLLLNELHAPVYSEGLIGTDILEGNEGPKIIQISGPIAGGYSGAPIVLQSEPSKILAVVANSPSKEAGDASIFRGIHWAHLKEIFDLLKS